MKIKFLFKYFKLLMFWIIYECADAGIFFASKQYFKLRKMLVFYIVLNLILELNVFFNMIRKDVNKRVAFQYFTSSGFSIVIQVLQVFTVCQNSVRLLYFFQICLIVAIVLDIDRGINKSLLLRLAFSKIGIFVL